ncbi:phosphate/phosphite/phosphonate ABC transporter substrate-binding protein [Sulfuriflexus sp.]|uniref:phosphate/phosphite/phosphonate ABC transporter substrate-binding protein n=1 Tax=Sulfuriflexus sp. TaxID=2015443 RepID=UPI0028CF638A|nr:phosphate/phosphite/phosphonate ABC transporter substrate-binding protein [Sulfuriflexus sp.]MDT8404404.1 phosphate/phosphite/phosphonate ABC transporter substrate-binding protein [Sulfuriflexus sp.]
MKFITSRALHLAAPFLLFSLSLLAGPACAEPVHRYSFAVVPQQNAMLVQQTWAPFLKALSLRTSMQFRLMVARSIPDFETDMLRGAADFAYMNPYHAVLVRQKPGYEPIIRSAEEKLQGILVVRRDSDITDIAQLDGKEVAFPSPNAFGASLLMRALLHSQWNINILPYYVETHANVYRNVLYKRTVAGGGVKRTLQQEHAGMQAQLRVLYETPGFAPHPISVHPRVPTVLAQRVQQAVIDIWQDKHERALLEKIQLSAPVAADYERDYAPLEQLGLEEYYTSLARN